MKLAIPVNERDRAIGPPDALVTAASYGDYERPDCHCRHREVEKMFDQLVNSVTNTLHLTNGADSQELDLCFLDLALALAAKGEGQVRPNPLVGAVVVKNGIIVGQGFHRYEGVKHAEVLALEEAGHLAIGATVYVNLEPCCHRGDGKRTPPCCDALIAAQVKRVVCCTTDPNPRVNGSGLVVLREAGIAVTVGPRTSAARILNAEYLRSVINSNASPAASLMQLLF